jgi:hypothetical protein
LLLLATLAVVDAFLVVTRGKIEMMKLVPVMAVRLVQAEERYVRHLNAENTV